jgi:hypothetical protein
LTDAPSEGSRTTLKIEDEFEFEDEDEFDEDVGCGRWEEPDTAESLCRLMRHPKAPAPP